MIRNINRMIDVLKNNYFDTLRSYFIYFNISFNNVHLTSYFLFFYCLIKILFFKFVFFLFSSQLSQKRENLNKKYPILIAHLTIRCYYQNITIPHAKFIGHLTQDFGLSLSLSLFLCTIVVGLFVLQTRLFLAILWPNSSGVGESGLAQLKLTLSQLVHKQGPIFAEILITYPQQGMLSQKCYGRRRII